MLGISGVASQMVASQKGLSSMKLITYSSLHTIFMLSVYKMVFHIYFLSYYINGFNSYCMLTELIQMHRSYHCHVCFIILSFQESFNAV
jgi:hypothetical protein